MYLCHKCVLCVKLVHNYSETNIVTNFNVDYNRYDFYLKLSVKSSFDYYFEYRFVDSG